MCRNQYKLGFAALLTNEYQSNPYCASPTVQRKRDLWGWPRHRTIQWWRAPRKQSRKWPVLHSINGIMRTTTGRTTKPRILWNRKTKVSMTKLANRLSENPKDVVDTIKTGDPKNSRLVTVKNRESMKLNDDIKVCTQMLPSETRDITHFKHQDS